MLKLKKYAPSPAKLCDSCHFSSHVPQMDLPSVDFRNHCRRVYRNLIQDWLRLVEGDVLRREFGVGELGLGGFGLV